MGKKIYKRKRSLDTSSCSSNWAIFRYTRALQKKRNRSVTQKALPQHGNKEIQPTACGTISLRDEGNEISVSDSDDDASNFSCNSAVNLCSSKFTEEKCFESYFESLAKRRSQSLDSRPGQMKNESTSSLSPSRKEKHCFRRTFSKWTLLEHLKCSGVEVTEMEVNQIAHPKKKCKTSIYKSPIFDSVKIVYGFVK